MRHLTVGGVARDLGHAEVEREQRDRDREDAVAEQDETMDVDSVIERALRAPLVCSDRPYSPRLSARLTRSAAAALTCLAACGAAAVPGAFAQAAEYGSGFRSVAIADVNGDGRGDLVGISSSVVSVLLG